MAGHFSTLSCILDKIAEFADEWKTSPFTSIGISLWICGEFVFSITLFLMFRTHSFDLYMMHIEFVDTHGEWQWAIIPSGVFYRQTTYRSLSLNIIQRSFFPIITQKFSNAYNWQQRSPGLLPENESGRRGLSKPLSISNKLSRYKFIEKKKRVCREKCLQWCSIFDL